MPDFKDFLGSRPFELLVGPDLKSFKIHSALLASASKLFLTLVDGNMKEAGEGTVSMETVDEATIVRFIEFLYKGDYHEDAEGLISKSKDGGSSLSTSRLDIDTLPIDGFERMEETESDTDSSDSSQSDASTMSVDESNSGYNDTRLRHFSTFKFVNVPDFTAYVRTTAEDDYIELYLSHARVYAFADLYDVERLKELSLHKLHKNLLFNDFSIQRSCELAELCRYAYTYTPHRSVAVINETIDLRNLLAVYSACLIEPLQQQDDFVAFMVETGEFMQDLIGWMVEVHVAK